MQAPSQSDATPGNAVAGIRKLNDDFRRTFVGGVVVLTAGVDALCPEVKAEVMRRVRLFDQFNSDNDPHGEHDFGSFEIAGQRFFFKLSYYDRQAFESGAEIGSENPADSNTTLRSLCIMLAEEY